MLGTRSAQSPGRPGRRASFTNPERDGLRLLLGASRHHSLSAAACFCSCCSAGLPSQALASRLPSLSTGTPTCHRTRRFDSGLVHFPTTGRRPLGASDFRDVQLSQSGSARISAYRLPEGHRVKEAVVTRVSPLLPGSNGPAEEPSLRWRGRADGRFAATSWRAAGEAGTKLQGGWPAFSEPVGQVTRTRIWPASRVSIGPRLWTFLSGSCDSARCVACTVPFWGLTFTILVPVVGLVCLRCLFQDWTSFWSHGSPRSSVWVTWTQEMLRVLFLSKHGASFFLPHIPCALVCVLGSRLRGEPSSASKCIPNNESVNNFSNTKFCVSKPHSSRQGKTFNSADSQERNGSRACGRSWEASCALKVTDLKKKS